jgi:hypothetical protein
MNRNKYVSIVPYAIPCEGCGVIYNVTARKKLALSIRSCEECESKKKLKEEKQAKKLKDDK